jgi:hypothetical protein
MLKSASENLSVWVKSGKAVTMLAEAGCTSPEIAAITGHISHVESILEKYLSHSMR